MRKPAIGVLCFFIVSGLCFAQGSNGSSQSDTSSGASFLPEGASIQAPDFDAQVTVGFNYDFLKDPTRVSFEYPSGYLGLNIPLKYGLDKAMTDAMTGDLANEFENGDEFAPTISAKQNPNTTIRVEVPMLRGVGMFSNIQNFYMRYSNTLGAPSIKFGMDTLDIRLLLKGMIAVPIEASVGWETMTFGYAYQINKNLKFAVNLHRHIFRLDIVGNMDIDLRGYIGYSPPEVVTSAIEDVSSEIGGVVESTTEDLLSAIDDINFGYTLKARAAGHYEVETWSPTFSVHAWRFGIVSRIGINTRAPGYLSAKYIIPFFMNPETFAVDEITADYALENMNRFANSETDSIEYSTTSDLIWKMPHAFTFSFDMVREKLWISYTKLIGETQMNISNITTFRMEQGGDTANTIEETVDFDVGVSVDHIIMLHGKFRNAFANLGIFSMDFRFADNEDLLEQSFPVVFGGGGMLPVLNFGTTFGSKIKLLLELDVLPLSALRTGVIYYF